MPISAAKRKTVIDRAAGCCEYCWSQARFATQSFSVEHILPRALGSNDELENLALSCQGCNNHKFIKTALLDPITNLEANLFHPRVDLWNDHFIWSEDYSRIICLTPTGRASVLALQLNRDGVVNLRQALFALGKHPPKRD
jgi:HNH endonuclease